MMVGSTASDTCSYLAVPCIPLRLQPFQLDTPGSRFLLLGARSAGQLGNYCLAQGHTDCGMKSCLLASQAWIINDQIISSH